MRDQLRRASISMVINITEGSDRFSKRIRKTSILLPEVQLMNVFLAGNNFRRKTFNSTNI
ncbi:MAG: hypothetical protein PHX78_03155 [bacterium]|nr:hypothetical protein [bacterium]